MSSGFIHTTTYKSEGYRSTAGDTGDVSEMQRTYVLVQQ